jgi:putative membrane protein
MKNVLWAAIFITLLSAGCHSRPGNKLDENAAEEAETPGDTRRKNSQTNEEAEKNVIPDAPLPKDGDFAREAAEAGLTEVALGKLAMERGRQKRVKQFGEMMVTDHTAANAELIRIAGRKGIQLPNESECNKCEDERKALADLQGAEFDKKYIEMMVQGHRKVADQFSKESADGKDEDLKNFAAKTLPAIKHHLSMAEAMHNGHQSKR